MNFSCTEAPIPLLYVMDKIKTQGGEEVSDMLDLTAKLPSIPSGCAACHTSIANPAAGWRRQPCRPTHVAENENPSCSTTDSSHFVRRLQAWLALLQASSSANGSHDRRARPCQPLEMKEMHNTFNCSGSPNLPVPLAPSCMSSSPLARKSSINPCNTVDPAQCCLMKLLP